MPHKLLTQVVKVCCCLLSVVVDVVVCFASSCCHSDDFPAAHAIDHTVMYITL